MIINNVLEHIFSSPSNVSVLRTLNSRMVGISGREVARISKLSNRTVQSVLANLESLGLVNRTIGGRDHLLTLNRNNKIE
jgi:predicted transcriptional regulator